MRTYSHFLLTAALQSGLKRRGIRVCTWAILLGSVLPDVPFFLLSMSYIAYYGWVAGVPIDMPFFMWLDSLYKTDPFWGAAHNIFHAPFPIALLAGAGYLALRRGRAWGFALFWFAVGCGFHALLDILTHHDDGPLLLFPFNWNYRFASPISYWDPNHYGVAFTRFERLLNLVIIAGYLGGWAHRRWKQRVTTAPTHPGAPKAD